jgi:AcrR family transcriptional regulator
VERFQRELFLLQKEKVQKLVEAAQVEFYKNGIMNSKLRNIAKRAKVGEATLYRSFKDKCDLVRLVAFKYWYDIQSKYFAYVNELVNPEDLGIEKAEAFLSVFKDLYINHADFIKFIQEYDAYVKTVATKRPRASFVDIMTLIKGQFEEMIESGIKDGSIRKDIDINAYYDLVTYVIISTMQKLSERHHEYNKTDIDNVDIVDNLLEMFLYYIKSEK